MREHVEVIGGSLGTHTLSAGPDYSPQSVSERPWARQLTPAFRTPMG
jgi:hypothetical protein